MRRAVPLVSVIIPALNEERLIARCLDSVLAQDLPRHLYEVIVVDNGSVDRTVEVARQYPVRVMSAAGAPVGAVRNRGASVARGSVYAFLDADCIADPDWLRRGIAVLRQGPAVAGSPCAIPRNAGWIETAWFGDSSVGRAEAAYVNAGNLLVSARVFHRLGGFDGALPSGEDAEFCARAKGIARIVSDPRIRVTHLGNPQTLRQFFRREMWHGAGALGSARHQIVDKPLIGTVAFLLLTLWQACGLAAALFGQGALHLLGATAALLGLLGATLAYRRDRWTGAPQRLAALLVLHYLFFLARGVALVAVCLGRAPGRTHTRGGLPLASTARSGCEGAGERGRSTARSSGSPPSRGSVADPS